MKGNRLNLALLIASVFLVLSLIFCGLSIHFAAGDRRKDNETDIQPYEELIIATQRPVYEQIILDPDEPYQQPGGSSEAKENNNASREDITASAEQETGNADEYINNKKGIIVIDAGHGKPSSSMTSDEKKAEGFEYNEQKGTWGEWRHYKNDTFGDDCHGSGCTLTAPSKGSCWYPMGNGDRSTEPEVNLNNAFAAQKYLEEMGYEVRMTRTSNDRNPSMNKRVSYCFPENNTSADPDADLFVCLHSNAGGGRGTAYISLGGEYRQLHIPPDYVSVSNEAGSIINRKIAAASALTERSPIGSEEYLILFNKSPVPIAYMEIGFYDNSSDLAILQSSSDAIGKAVAEGVDEFLNR